MPIIPLTLTVLSNGAVPVYVNLVGMILHGYYRSTSFSIKLQTIRLKQTNVLFTYLRKFRNKKKLQILKFPDPEQTSQLEPKLLFSDS